jgi:hypothetical protein
MRSEDIVHLEHFLRDCRESVLTNIKRVLFCSPDNEEIIRVKDILKNDEIVIRTRETWDLNNIPDTDSDLVVICNTLMCSNDPKKWIDNACSRTRWVIVLDVCIGHRGGSEGERAVSDGDVMRYTMPPHMVAKCEDAFDLNQVKERIIKLLPFKSPTECRVEGYEVATQFVMLLKGDKS